MDLRNLDQLLEDAARLSPSERLLLASRLIQGVRDEMPPGRPHRKWSEAAGMLPDPALGEEAQAYISRSRRSDDSYRSHVIRDGE